MRQTKPPRLWDIYKQGGFTSAITSMFNTQNAQHMAYIRSAMKEQRKEAALVTPIKELQVTVLDLETSGFFPSSDEILSIGAIKADGGVLKEGETFYSLVQTKRPIPPKIKELTGITDELTAQGLNLAEALLQFLRFIENRALIAHGSGHDKQFLNVALWQTSRVRLSHRFLDTMMIARWLRPDMDSYGLDEVLDSFGIEVTTRHHALEDAIMTAKLWLRFVEEMSERQVITLNDLYAHLSK